MKIVKHCHEESTNNIDVAQGALLGLVVDNRLEITNCFPFPKVYDESVDEGKPNLKRLNNVLSMMSHNNHSKSNHSTLDFTETHVASRL